MSSDTAIRIGRRDQSFQPRERPFQVEGSRDIDQVATHLHQRQGYRGLHAADHDTRAQYAQHPGRVVEHPRHVRIDHVECADIDHHTPHLVPGDPLGQVALEAQHAFVVDVGTQSWMDVINKSEVPLDKILSNILLVARSRPVIIQSLFASVDGADPSVEQIDQYAQRLRELKEAGAQIPLVQIYSASRPVHNFRCRHLPLRSLSQIAQTVRRVSGLKAEVF